MAKKAELHKHLRVYPFEQYKKWLQWLKKNHTQQEGIWIKFAKKNSGIKSISYEEAREGAIIYGWIDGLINGLDEDYFLRKFTPRRPKSMWSKINREIAEQLIRDKKMKPSGMEQVHAAQADGRWDAAYDPQADIKLPAELQRLINSNKAAKKNFAELNSANRYAFLFKIQNAKRPETKKRHIDKVFEMLCKGETYLPQKDKKNVKKAAKKKK